MDKHYDVVVVGAGNGGLAAAAVTSQAGFKVLLLEKHNIPGGSASSFKRGRFEFEPSLHELCAVGKPDQLFDTGKLFKRFGAEVDFRYEDNTFRAICTAEDGYDVRMRAGEDNFCDDLEAIVPGCRESLKAWFELERGDQRTLDYIDSKNGKPNPIMMILKHGNFMRDTSYTVEEVQKALGMPEKARNILNTYWGYLGVPTDELNSFHYMTMVASYVRDGAVMPYKRSHEMSLALEKAITDNGGDVWYNSEVVKFLYNEDGSCAGVQLKSGEKIYAKEIISNVIPNNVYAMSDVKYVPEKELRLANSRTLGLSFVTVYLGMDCSKEELGVEDYTTFISKYANPRECYNHRNEGAYYVVNCHNVAIPDASPEGTCMLFYTIPMMEEDFPKDLKPEEYKKWKNSVAKRFIEDSEKVLGIDITSHIEEIEVATPVTFARYLGTPAGEIYGYQMAGWDSILPRIMAAPTDFTVKNLSYCGGHAERGDGYSCAYMTGMLTGDAVVRRLKGGK